MAAENRQWETWLTLVGAALAVVTSLFLFGLNYRVGTAFVLGIAGAAALIQGFRGRFGTGVPLSVLTLISLAFLVEFSEPDRHRSTALVPWDPSAVSITPSMEVPADSLSALELSGVNAEELANRTSFLPAFVGPLELDPVSPSHLTVARASGNHLPVGATSRYIVQSRTAAPIDVRVILMRTTDGWALFSGQVRQAGDTAVVRPLKPPRVIGAGNRVKGYRVTLTGRPDEISFADSTEITIGNAKLLFLDSLVDSRPEGLFIRKVETRPLRVRRRSMAG